MGVALQVDDRVGHGLKMQKEGERMKNEIWGGWLIVAATGFWPRSGEGN